MFWNNKQEKIFDRTCHVLLDITMETIFRLEDKQNKPFPNNGAIEALIFYEIVIKKRFYYVDKKLHDRIVEKLDAVFLSTLVQMHLDEKVPDILKFINDRITLYLRELDEYSNDGYYLPHFIYYLFFENPLSEEPEFVDDPIMLMKFKNSLTDTINYISEVVDKIVKK